MTDNVDTTTIDTDCGVQNPELLRRSPRFSASSDREMTVILQRAEDREPREVRGTILDLSLGGAKLAAPAEFGLQEAIKVRWDIDDVDVDLVVAAKICWARTAGPDSWRLGCAFEDELPESLISELSVQGYIDRREDCRHIVATKATIQWELTQDTTPVQLHDLSTSGFCMVCPQCPPVGSRCRLIMGGPEGESITIPANVRWQRNAADGFLVGCEFLESDAHLAIDRAVTWVAGVEEPSPATESSRDAQCDARPRVSVAAAAKASAQWIDTLTVREAARGARTKLVVAMTAIGAAFILMELARTAGPIAWCGGLLAMLTGALWTASYHRWTNLVLEKADQAGDDA